MQRCDFLVIGGGIVGLATARALLQKRPGSRLTMLEKEPAIAQHQSGRNSGVLHSGIYYPHGSLKAALCLEGGAALISYCRERGVPVKVCGKLIVAVEQGELPRLEALYQRGLEHGLAVRRLSAEEAQEREPHIACLAALHVPSTGIVDYPAVCRALAEDIVRLGGEILTSSPVVGIYDALRGHRVRTPDREFETAFLINCAGLHSDRVARMAGLHPEVRILPFRGEFFNLLPPAQDWVRNLLYPVPDPRFPFLGIHFTRGIHGGVHVGPNAVLAASREGYSRSSFEFSDLADAFSFPGFWRLTFRYPVKGLSELFRSTFRSAFAAEARRILPDLEVGHLTPAPAGVRAQAVRPDGRMVDDFFLMQSPHAIHVLNAPSPAATACLAIASFLTGLVRETP